ncbi:SGNH/GDSL hydrolase family protein [Verrucomicrobiota bacterium]
MAFDVRRRMISPIILLLLSTTFALTVVELSLRASGIGYGNAPQEPHSIFHHVHPANYRFVSHTPTGEYGGHDIYYDGDRLVANPSLTHAENDASACRVAFLGDSFTEAGQVAFDNSFVGILQRESDCIVKNYGMSSYSPILYLLQWQRIVRDFNPSLVVVQLYGNDIASDEACEAIARKDTHGKVIAIPGTEGGWVTQQLRKSYLMRFLRKVQLQLLWMYDNKGKEKDVVAGIVEENPDITTLSARLIIQLAKEVQDSGAQFVLTAVPSKVRIVKNITDNQMPQFSDKWKLLAQQHNITFMDLTEPFEREAEAGFQPFFDRDIHFNENGHIVFASELSKLHPHLLGPIPRSRLTRRSIGQGSLVAGEQPVQ